MSIYKTMYFHLMRGVSDVMEQLIQLQNQTEEMYLSHESHEETEGDAVPCGPHTVCEERGRPRAAVPTAVCPRRNP